jgi:hypothetical protein
MIKFPKHMSMTIAHNEHKNCYQSVIQYFDHVQHRKESCTPEEFAEMIATDEIWEIQWYPRTPISFYYVMAATFEKALEMAMEIDKDDYL